MKRLLLAIVVLLGPAVGLASAQYLMIKIDLNKLLAPPPPPGVNPGVPAPGPMPGKRKKGGPGVPGVVAPAPGTQPPGSDDDEPPLWAVARLELKRTPEKTVMVRGSPVPLMPIEHHWGSAFVPRELGDLGVVRPFATHSVARRFVAKKKALANEGKTADKLVQLAEWALEHGLTAPFLETMDEVRKEDANHPAVKALDKIRAEMKRRVSGNDPAAAALVEELKGDNFRMVPSDGGHYVLFTDLLPGPQNELDVKKCLDGLETTYHNFFYWFALKGKVLPVPTHRLVAVLVKLRSDFDAKHQSYAPGPRVDDGFLVRRDNVAVLSALRLDEAYVKLEKINLHEWQTYKVSRDELLSGAVVKRVDLAGNPMQVAKLQTMAILQKAMEEEAERAAVTHEGTLQLLAASGLLPRGVLAGEWVHFGMASFFETPYKTYYPGTALPSWLYLVEFKHFQKSGELGESTDVLLRTITDQFFVAANARQQQIDAKSELRDELEPLLQEDLKTARTTAWALTYYLARYRLDGLQQYFQELGSLPGELDFDEGVLLGCFARAFGLVDATDPGKLDMSKVTALATDWYKRMDGVSLDLMEVQADELKERAKVKHGPQHHVHHRPPPRAWANPNPRAGANPPPQPPAVRPKRPGG